MNHIFSQKENDYKSSLKKTEKNLSSMKSQLDKRMRKPINQPTFSTSMERYDMDYPQIHTRNTHDIASSRQHKLFSSLNSDALVSSLLKRAEEQTKSIWLLQKTVKAQSKAISNLKEHLTSIQNRSIDNEAISARKFEVIQLQIRNEVEQAVFRIRQKTSHNSYTQDSLNLSNRMSLDLNSQKRKMENEMDAIRKEQGALKARFIKIEQESNTFARNMQDYNRRCMLLERDVTSLTNEQRRQRREENESDITHIKNEIQDISNLVNGWNTNKKETLQMAKQNEPTIGTVKDYLDQSKESLTNFDEDDVTIRLESDGHSIESINDDMINEFLLQGHTNSRCSPDFIDTSSLLLDDDFELSLYELNLGDEYHSSSDIDGFGDNDSDKSTGI